MSRPSLMLHAKLYRARCIDEAIRECGAQGKLTRRREGAYHVVEPQSLSDDEAVDLLDDVANQALFLTVEQEGD